jgi:amino acid transporter
LDTVSVEVCESELVADKHSHFPVANMTAICGIISWSGILWTSIRWHKGLKIHGVDRRSLPYRAPLQPYLSYYGLTVCGIVLIFGGFGSFIHKFDTSSFITTYFPIPFFAVLFIGYKFYHKTNIVKYENFDLVTGSSDDVVNMVS